MRLLGAWLKTTMVVCTLMALAAGCCPKPPAVMGVLMIVSPDNHERADLAERLAERLIGRGDMHVVVARDLSVLNGPALSCYRVLVFNAASQAELGEPARQAILAHVRSGGGLVAMHAGLAGFRSWPQWAELVGAAASDHDKRGPCECTVLDAEHAALLGIGDKFTVTDEPYAVDHCDPSADVLMIRRRSGGPPAPRVWTRRVGQGRVWATVFGHDQAAQDDEQFITLLHNGIRWSAGLLPDARHNALTRSERQEGYELIFNGRDLAGWTGDTGHWTVENGELVGRADNLPEDGFLVWPKEYGDFVLHCSVRLPEGQGNSGVVFRCRPLERGAVLGYEADVAPDRYGTLYEEGGRRGVLVEGYHGIGEQIAVPEGWNDLAVRAEGPRITLTLNGIVTAEYEAGPADTLSPRGSIALELHARMKMQVRFRDIRIKSLENARKTR